MMMTSKEISRIDKVAVRVRGESSKKPSYASRSRTYTKTDADDKEDADAAEDLSAKIGREEGAGGAGKMLCRMWMRMRMSYAFSMR